MLDRWKMKIMHNIKKKIASGELGGIHSIWEKNIRTQELFPANITLTDKKFVDGSVDFYKVYL